MFIYALSFFLTITAFVDTNAKYGIPLSRYTVLLKNCPLEYNSIPTLFCLSFTHTANSAQKGCALVISGEEVDDFVGGLGGEDEMLPRKTGAAKLLALVAHIGEGGVEDKGAVLPLSPHREACAGAVGEGD